MIYGRLWLVVKPTVGIPLFLTAVAISSFTVHYMLLTHTTWLPKFYEGNQRVAQVDATTRTAAILPSSTVVLAPTPVLK